MVMPDSPSPARIKVVGVGGGGGNAVSRMMQAEVRGIEYIAVNTDIQALDGVTADRKLIIGTKVTGGLGAGGHPSQGTKAAEETSDQLFEVLREAEMVFITAGMGGGTGTGSIPLVAGIAKQSGALTIAVVTRPFSFEGNHRAENAERGIMELMDKCDTLIIIPNDKLLDLVDQKTGVDGAFKLADEVLFHGVQAIAEVVTVPGLINLDYADIRTIMKDAGPAWMSIGRGSGQNRAKDAAREALSSPLLDVSVSGAKGVLFNIAGGSSLSLFEVNDAAEVIRQAVDPDANVIFGVVLDPNMGNDIRLTLIATGFASKEALAGASWEKEISKLLKGVRSEEEFGVPSFMRYKTSLPSSKFRSSSQPRNNR